MSRFTKFIRRFRKDERGNMLIEFALAIPLIFGLFMTSVEMGMLALNQMWLDRGMDMSVRLIRLNTGANYEHDDIKDMICEFSGNLKDCDQVLRLEMKTLNPRDFSGFPNDADCVDTSQPVTPLRQFVHGGNHQLMLLRACYKFKPIFALNGLGKEMDTDGSGRAKMVALSVFVQEPT